MRVRSPQLTVPDRSDNAWTIRAKRAHSGVTAVGCLEQQRLLVRFGLCVGEAVA